MKFSIGRLDLINFLPLTSKLSIFWKKTSFFRAVKRSGPNWNFRLKDLRHYFGSTHINAGVDSIIVAQMMGHADIGMIHRNYGHISNEGLENSRQKVSS